MKVFFYKYWKTTIWFLLSAFALFTPGENLPAGNILQIYHIDKVIHFVIFLFLQFLFLFDFGYTKRSIPLKNQMVIFLAVIVYAALSELIQVFFITERNGSWFDFIADILGMTAGILLYTLFKKRTVRPY
ncbi:MAG: VanZ family protein [Bacteroidales bacterium]|nr:VanZ family protein [Bacteroidales bacterium]